tara:strand:- start:57 stop:557 length:501 start_codon:yes stop_codon:yes gene_type:complete
MVLRKTRKFKYPDYFKSLAYDIGKARSLISSGIYKKGTKKFRGDKEKNISTLGVLGELIVRHFFYIDEIIGSFNPIVDEFPVVDSDCDVSNFKFDIKTVKENSSYYLINKQAHENKEKYNKITHYLFVVLESNCVAHIVVFNKQDVWNWEEHKARYTEVYRRRINE